MQMNWPYLKQTRLVVAITAICCFSTMMVAYHLTTPITSVQPTFPRYGTTAVKVPSETISQTCILPQLNPWDPQIANFIQHPPPVTCKRVQADHLVFINDTGFLEMNLTALASIESKHVNCTFRYCWAQFPAPNENISFSQPYALHYNVSVPVETDCVEVQCNDTDNGKEIYYFVHNHPADASLLNQALLPNSDEHLSVLLFVMDSLSASAAQRNLPQTRNYLTQVMLAKELSGYTKIGHNSFPNMMPVLTGKRTSSPQKDMQPEIWPGRNGDFNVKFDDWPLIWKEFSKRGYVTAFSDDVPKYSLFYHGAQGFDHKPVDHFYFNTWWLLYNSRLYQRSSSHCTGNEPTLHVFLQQVEVFLKKYKDTRFFSMPYYMELQHDHDNEVEKGDLLLRDFFKRAYENNLFNKSIVVFFSDHGIRYDRIRSTEIGKLEDFMPYFSITFPEWFYRLHPGISKNLDINRNRLSSHFDTHFLLQDILHGQYDNLSYTRYDGRGISQLLEIPLNRTCAQAGIPLEYCPCIARNEANITDPIFSLAANLTIEFINSQLSNHTHACHEIKLSKITQAWKLASDMANITGHHFAVSVLTTPNNATFESQLRVVNSAEAALIVDAVVRTNLYGQQADCMSEKASKKRFKSGLVGRKYGEPPPQRHRHRPSIATQLDLHEEQTFLCDQMRDFWPKLLALPDKIHALHVTSPSKTDGTICLESTTATSGTSAFLGINIQSTLGIRSTRGVGLDVPYIKS